MGKQFEELSEKHIEFIQDQKIFFVATATADSLINLSPKGMDTLRVENSTLIIWLNLTGSGNETAAHIDQDGRMTMMWCAFEGKPLILRAYGRARVIHPRDEEWEQCLSMFPKIAGTRQFFILDIQKVQSSCGMAVPFMDFKEERKELKTWAEKQGEEKVEKYWEDRNQLSLDGIPTKILR